MSDKITLDTLTYLAWINSQTSYIFKESNFNFWYARLNDLDIQKRR